MLSQDQIFKRVRELYKGPLCIDLMKEAQNANTLDEAAMILITDSQFWDGSIFDVKDD